jgi:hypothetical protein
MEKVNDHIFLCYEQHSWLLNANFIMHNVWCGWVNVAREFLTSKLPYFCVFKFANSTLC